jgi:hypothetical protein
MTSPRVHALPHDEAQLLSDIAGSDARNARVARLTALGWSLASIGESLSPPRARSTVRAWRESADTRDVAADALARPELPAPPSTGVYALLSRAPVPAREGTVRVGLPPDTRDRIAELAPLARRYRAGTLSSAPAARASLELDALVAEQYARGVAVPALARAAGVTYRAMSSRLRRLNATRPSVPTFTGGAR